MRNGQTSSPNQGYLAAAVLQVALVAREQPVDQVIGADAPAVEVADLRTTQIGHTIGLQAPASIQ